MLRLHPPPLPADGRLTPSGLFFQVFEKEIVFEGGGRRVEGLMRRGVGDGRGGVEWRVATAQNEVLPRRNVSFSKKWVLCKSTLPLFFVLVRFLFLYRGSIIKKKKKRAPGQHPLEDPYCGRIWVKLKGRGGGTRWWHQVVAPCGGTTWCHHLVPPPRPFNFTQIRPQ